MIISTKLDGNMLEGWGFRFVLLGPNKGQNKENFDKYSKIFSSTTSQNALLCGKNLSLGERIQVCSNEVPRVMYGSM